MSVFSPCYEDLVLLERSGDGGDGVSGEGGGGDGDGSVGGLGGSGGVANVLHVVIHFHSCLHRLLNHHRVAGHQHQKQLVRVWGILVRRIGGRILFLEYRLSYLFMIGSLFTAFVDSLSLSLAL